MGQKYLTHVGNFEIQDVADKDQSSYGVFGDLLKSTKSIVDYGFVFFYHYLDGIV
jgi:hypothetical protein